MNNQLFVLRWQQKDDDENKVGDDDEDVCRELIEFLVY